VTSRKFVLEITETGKLTVGELTRAISRTAGLIDVGRLQLEGGPVRNTAGQVIGSYKWAEAEPP
jgi:hypothetical protein